MWYNNHISYDIKYRQRVIDYMSEGHTEKEAAEVFKVSTFTLWKWKSKLNETGNLEPKKRKETWRKIDPAKLEKYVKQHPDAYLKEIAEEFGCTDFAILKALRRLKITRKKNHSLQGD